MQAWLISRYTQISAIIARLYVLTSGDAPLPAFTPTAGMVLLKQSQLHDHDVTLPSPDRIRILAQETLEDRLCCPDSELD